MKQTLRWVIGIVLVSYIGMALLLNTPYIQQRLSVFVAQELETLLGTEVSMGRINIGLLNRIVVEDLLLNDRSGKEMLRVARFSAKFDMLPLLRGRVSISNIQLFGFHAVLEKATPQSPPNFQFLVDAFASKDTVPRKNNLDLRINSLLLRRGRVSYNVLSEAETPGRFNAHHINLRNVIASLSLKALCQLRLPLTAKAKNLTLALLGIRAHCRLMHGLHRLRGLRETPMG